MAGLDPLTDSQRAILQLLLKRAKSYGEIDTMLKLPVDTARQRAHDAIAALGPERAQIGDARCHEIADYLLGQQTPAARAATNEYLAGSADGRKWARAVADALRPIALHELPVIPREPVQVAPVSPPAADPPHSGRPDRDSHLSTKLLYGALGLAVAIVLILALGVFGGGGDDDESTTSTVTRTAPANSPQTIAQGMLIAPEDGEATAQAGIIRYPQTNNFKLLVAAKKLSPPPRGSAYGIWLFTSESEKLFLGFPEATVSDEGALDVVADLAPDTPNFDEVLVTRETVEQPPIPGDIVLRGDLVVATPPQGQTQTQTQTQPSGP